MEYNKNWDALSNILYDENGTPRKKIGKKYFKKVIDQVETIEDGFVRAYLGNNQDVMADLVNRGLFVLNFFTHTLPPEKKTYLKLGELRGHISLMGRILSTMVERNRSLHLFNEFQKRFPYAKDIILCIGDSYSIEKKEVIKKNRNGDSENTITNLVLWGFVYEQNFGKSDILYLSDTGRRVYNHYTSNKDEIFYRH